MNCVCVWNSSAMSPIIFCSWTIDPRGISLGHMLTGCPHTRPRASGVLMEPRCTPGRTTTIQVCRAGKSLPQYLWFYSSYHNNSKGEQTCSPFLGLTLPSTSRPCCFCLSLLSYDSDYMVKEQHCRMQRRGIRSRTQESRSPDSACSLGYDSRGSSPDHVLDGEAFM